MPDRSPVAAQLRSIEFDRPADLILRQLRALIANGTLKAGDRLPSERELAVRFGVGRGYVRDALRRLEFYGILQTFPQSGTVVASLGGPALERLISSVLALDREDLEALTETREVLEIAAARYAAERASKASIAAIGRSLDAFRAEVEAGREGVEEDHLFHLAIAHAAGNAVMASLIGMVTPDVIRLNKARQSCEGGRARYALAEHERVHRAIAARDAVGAMRAMGEHMRMTREQNATVVAASQGRKRTKPITRRST